MRSHSRALLVWSLSLVAACASKNNVDTGLAECGPAGQCPSGYTCSPSNNLCIASGTGIDAAPLTPPDSRLPPDAAQPADAIPSPDALVPPPDTMLTSAPASLTNQPSASFSFTSSDPGATFQCSLDGTGYASCTSPAAFSGLADGMHTFSVRAVGAGGPDPTPATAAWTIDTQAPIATITSGPSNGGTSGSSVSFTYTTTTGGAGVTFACELDSVGYAPCSAGGVSYGGLVDGSTHVFSVEATDAAGNTSAPVSVSFTVDLNGPTVTVTSPVGGGVVQPDFSLVFTATSALPATYACTYDGAPITSCVSGRGFMNQGPGGHSITVQGTDSAGKKGNLASVTFSVAGQVSPDAGAPVIGAPTIDSPAAGGVTGPSGSVTYSLHGAASSTCTLDGAQVSCGGSSYSFGGLGGGEHTFTLTSLEASGRIVGTVSVSWTVDATGPVMDVSAPTAHAGIDAPANSCASGNVAYSCDTAASGPTDCPPALVECSLDGAAFAACSSTSFAYTGLSPGAHTFAVEATDAYGNVGMPATTSIVVDEVGPTVTITRPTAGGATATSGASTPIVYTSSGQLVSCTIHSGGLTGAQHPCTQSGGQLVASGLTQAENPYTVEVVTADGCGTLGSATVTWNVDTTAPAISFVGQSPAEGATVGADVEIDFGSNDPHATYTCALNGASPTTCTSPVMATLAAGAYTFQVTATDAFGNAGMASLDFNVQTATTPVLTQAECGRTYNLEGFLTEADCDAIATEAAAFSCTCAWDGQEPVACGDFEAGDCQSEDDDCSVQTGDDALAPGINTVHIVCTVDGTSTSGSTDVGVSAAFATGNAILIGHDFSSSNPALQTLIANSLALTAATEFDYPRGVQVMIYVGPHSDSTELTNIETAITDAGATFATSTLADIATDIQGYDVLLIPDQNDPSSAPADLGTAWAAALTTYVAYGGVVVGLDGLDGAGDPSGSYRVLTSAGLFPDVLGVNGPESVGSNCVSHNQPVSQGLSVYSAPASTVSFIVNSTDPDLVATVSAVTGQDDNPVVVERDFPDCFPENVAFTVVVDASLGDDNLTGSCLFPFKTITHAIVATAAITGPDIKVLPGTYDSDLGEVFPITPAAGTTLTGLEGGVGTNVEITGTGRVPLGQETDPQAALFINATNVNISGFGISGDGDGIYYLDATGRVQATIIHDAGGVGIEMNNAQIVLAAVTLTDNADGLWVEQATDTVAVTESTITHNTNAGVRILAAADVDLGGGDLQSEIHSVIEPNVLSCNGESLDITDDSVTYVSAQNDEWDNNPPTTNCSGDICPDNATVNTTGGTLASPSCTTVVIGRTKAPTDGRRVRH